MSIRARLYILLRAFGHQFWIRNAIRDKIVRLFISADNGGDHEFTVEYFGLKYRGNLNQYIDWSVYFFGGYEKQEIMLLNDLLKFKDKPVFIDIGANRGIYSLAMSRICKEVHSFEPYDIVLDKLKINISLNNINNIHVHEFGLGEKDDEIKFYMPTSNNNDGTGSFLSEGSGINKYKKLKIINGDEYFSKLNLCKIDFVKIDVEGYEKYVLSGMKNTLLRYRPTVLLECTNPETKNFMNSDVFNNIFNDYKVSSVVTNEPIYYFLNRSSCKLYDYSKGCKSTNILLQPKV